MSKIFDTFLKILTSSSQTDKAMNTANTLPDKNAKNRAITALKKKKNHIDSHEENKRKPIFKKDLVQNTTILKQIDKTDSKMSPYLMGDTNISIY